MLVREKPPRIGRGRSLAQSFSKALGLLPRQDPCDFRIELPIEPISEPALFANGVLKRIVGRRPRRHGLTNEVPFQLRTILLANRNLRFDLRPLLVREFQGFRNYRIGAQ
jgi:hypothetical protein